MFDKAAALKILPEQNEAKSTEIPVLPEQANYDLSHSQQRLLILDELSAETNAYCIPSVFQVRGVLDQNRLNESLEI